MSGIKFSDLRLKKRRQEEFRFRFWLSIKINILTSRFTKTHFITNLHHKVSQPHSEASVRMKVTLPKVGTWSPPRLPQFQSSIAEVKTTRLEMFFIPLERS
jgi:hypothetical protein